LNRIEAAQYLELAPQTLDTWRSLGKGPRCVTVGRKVRYRVADRQEWLDSQVIESTSG